MTAALGTEFDPPFDILEPGIMTAPLIFNSPHSGQVYPHSFLKASRLDPLALRRSEDSFVDELFAGVVSDGLPLMRARFPRAFLDVNREPYELDPRMFDGRLPPFANTRSMRVAGGLGTIARVVSEYQEIYARRLPVEEGLRRIDTLYKPYHRALRRLLQTTQRRFGIAVLVDCHSMPSNQTTREDTPRADIVLGDRYGTSAAPAFIDAAERVLRQRGYSVARNKPYAGGFITEHYGNPAGRCHALQIEVSRGLYMDESRIERSAGLAMVAVDLLAVARALSREALDFTATGRLAAE
jgi:N-formylglutamate amidohydrolase